ncbi:hypothetical protein KY290_026311 [Solanum tuberosum]|uniref:Serine-threonine/tyrosine-protein kinase catalytic domain-containing protein n=1 Tax=Solanum tuberosum TaxID=4113 RepID=A0ABQ7UW29_SOLTU|nr:hypothetical protein KY284_025255 [Solanum tuberosum]KAH0707342.1 hypothetical protein KY289_012418 [Solanum tuberosum]KAH0736223.1 hypothetical protein KY285_011930 [Solanum tuberosum]KAH0756041.1 hypothetical protein KY290_026311 [Solanum tuberosum]
MAKAKLDVDTIMHNLVCNLFLVCYFDQCDSVVVFFLWICYLIKLVILIHSSSYAGGIVNNTLRPTIPNYCDSEWRCLMEQCWAPNPASRPSFTEIASRLRLLSSASQNKTTGQKATK